MKLHRMTPNDSFTANPTSITVCADPLYTHQICQPRRWHTAFDTSYSLPDTTFSITYFDKVDIYVALGSELFVYSPSLSKGNNIVFVGNSSPKNILNFNSVTDSIYFTVYYSTGGLGTAPTVNEISYHTR